MSAKAPWAGAVGGSSAGAVGGRAASSPSTHALTASEAAWLAALPCALVLVAAIVMLGPPLGRALFEPRGEFTFWPHYLTLRAVRPEPLEQARFVLALLGPPLLVVGVLVLTGRRMRDGVSGALALASQVLLAGFVVLCIVAQHRHAYGNAYFDGRPRPAQYFTISTLVVASAIALVVALALHHRPTVARVASLARETTAKRVAAAAVAGLATGAWLLSVFNTERTLASAHDALQNHITFWTDESFAILNGHAPLVDFHTQYGHLWAYVAAGGMSVFGTSLGVYITISLLGTAGAMGAVYATLRRIAGTSLLALALFLPFLATSFFLKIGPLDNRYSPATLFSLFPIRYLGPYVLLWWIVRRIARRSAGRHVPLLAFAALVVVNNPEFGLPAYGATLAALAWIAPSRSARALARLAAEAALGLACAVALVALLTLVIAGSLPDFGLLLTFPRIFATEGFGLLAMPPLGLHLVVYVTFAAAIVVATVRAASGAEDRMLTAALVWAGVFGLGIGGYFAGRSHPHVLIDLFSIWSLALVLLTVVAVRAIVRRPSRRPTLAELLVLAGFGVAVCSLAQVPTPWSQIERLQRTAPANPGRPTTAAVVDALRQLIGRGEPVALLLLLGHRIAFEVGAVNVTPYVNIESMMTHEQWQETLAALRRAGGRSVILEREGLFDDQVAWLERAGYEPRAQVETLGLIRFDER